jgi:hypothetical protein
VILVTVAMESMGDEKGVLPTGLGAQVAMVRKTSMLLLDLVAI